MTILPPVAQDDDPWYWKLWIMFVRASSWIVEAGPDSIADDVGDHYQLGVQFFVVLELVLILFCFISTIRMGFWSLAILVAGHYLIGIGYRLHNKSWGM